MATEPKKKGAPPWWLAHRWWNPISWEIWHKPPAQLKRSPIPSLDKLMEVDQTSWEVMGRWANRLAYGAVIANLVICALYAFIVATQSELPLTRGWDLKIPGLGGQDFLAGATARWVVIGILAAMALISAVVMQLGSDFAIPFGAGLASEKHRVVPILSLVVFAVCITLTASIKMDVFSGWGRGRLAVAAEKVALSDADQKILAKYAAQAPDPLADSVGKIATADAEIARLERVLAEQLKLRASEETGAGAGVVAGRGPKWDAADRAVKQADADLAAHRTARATAIATKAQREEFDKATAHQLATVRSTTEAERSLIYDSPMIVDIRALGMSFISPFFVLVSFMVRASKAAAAKRREADLKRSQTRRDNANTFDVPFTEGAPHGAPGLGFDEGAVDGVTGRPGVGIHKPVDGRHPDATGDDYGARTSGYGGKGDDPDESKQA
jgi:hypothetical protein